ncbi:protein of unknown function [Cupriavidus taiwanensis]|nr:protein of unknown function [Cupriavidus taiwanensis]SOZ03756.1 hypothetical protein CBM2597_A40025 [Cupriavidus taiwanensis]SPD38352.1 protein of unknown function [Cupriavidus taiwanensis]
MMAKPPRPRGEARRIAPGDRPKVRHPATAGADFTRNRAGRERAGPTRRGEPAASDLRGTGAFRRCNKRTAS